MAEAVLPPVAAIDDRRRTVDLVFRGALAFNVALTSYWLFLVVSGRPSAFFSDYRADPKRLGGILIGFLFFNVIWGLVWWGVKTLLLAHFVGMTKEERKVAFSSRLDGRFDLADLTARYSERRIRIADMIGRRGRFMTLGLAGFFFLYANLAAEPKAGFASAFLQDNLFDAVVGSWLFLALYYVNGPLGAAVYGPQSRIMDGVLARANCLLITGLWASFKFALVPIGTQLAALYPQREFAPVFAIIWGSYMVSDMASEVVGSLFGRQKIRVYGMGEVNRKSVEGTLACFVASLAFCLWVVTANGLPAPWIVLAVMVSISNTVLELFSPRGTDDLTMTVGNAAICWAFGAWLY